MQTERQVKVFDTSLYPAVPETNRPLVLTEDLAGLVIEAGDRPLEERINPRLFRIVNGEVFDPKSRKNVREEWGFDTSLQERESAAANSFYDQLLANTGNLVISLSPSGGPAKYLEARVNVGYRKNEEEIEFYGIPSHMHPDALVNYAARLSEWNTLPLSITDPENLRELAIPIHLPEGRKPWEFLNEVAPLDSDAWNVIAQGTPWQIKERAEIDAQPIAQEMLKRLIYARVESDFVQIGAWGERKMQASGWKLKASACPGLFNSQISTFSNNSGFDYLVDGFGNLREISTDQADQDGSLTFNCDSCGAANKRPYGGRKPSCGGCGKKFGGC